MRGINLASYLENSAAAHPDDGGIRHNRGCTGGVNESHSGKRGSEGWLLRSPPCP